MLRINFVYTLNMSQNNIFNKFIKESLMFDNGNKKWGNIWRKISVFIFSVDFYFWYYVVCSS